MAVRVSPGGVIEFDQDSGGGPDGEATATGARLTKYDPRELAIIYGGLNLEKGIVAGTFLTAERMLPRWRLVPGCDGEMIRVRLNNRSAVLTLTLRRGTNVNDKLSAVHLADDASGLFALPFLVNDSNGRALHVGTRAWLIGPADEAYGTDEGSIVWIFECTTWIPYSGGLRPITTSLFPPEILAT